MKLKTIVIDDEASARSRLKKLLSSHPEIEIIGEAGDGMEAVQQVEALGPDLIFLDIQMPGLNGFQVLQALSNPLPLVIFATAYDAFALAAFEANAVGYLLKPINRERLAHAIDRARRISQVEPEMDAERKKVRQVVSDSVSTFPRQIVARKQDRFVLIPTSDIVLVMIEDSVVKIQTDSARFPTNYRLVDLENLLPQPPFFRAHRSAFVNIEKVKEIAPFFKSTFLLTLNDRDGTVVQVSERQSKQLRALLQGL
ncbi:MAG: response regulator transcription factor [Acidobacteria bacterium]|nr:response regulator transcription factor [Acidobacteriota bacterium]